MDEERREALRARAREVLAHNAEIGIPAPDFGADKEWLNVARPLSRAHDLAGKLVLLDFWTYCCINCMHVLPDLAFLEEKYRGEPFVVVGCHSAKFSNERELERVREAVVREGIEHPVVLDREFDIWKRYAIRAWPTLMLLSPDGRILGTLSGEGQLAVLDVLIEQALELYHARPGAFDSTPLPMQLEARRSLPRELRFPGKLVCDPRRQRLFVADSGHHRVLELTLDGRYVRHFGQGQAGFVDGPAGEARFRTPQGLAVRGETLFVADTANHAVRAIELETGAVETLVGNGRQGYERARVLPAQGAALDSPWDLCVHRDQLLIAMAGAHQIWSYDFASASIRPLAGDGAELHRAGAFELAAFAQPSGIAVHAERVFVADSEASALRVLELETRRVATLAGGAREPRDLFHFGDEDGTGFGRRLQHPLGVAVDPSASNDSVLVYVADTYNHKIKIADPDTGALASYAGSGEPGCVDGEADAARFCEPGGLAVCGPELFVADTNNHAIRVIDLEQHTVRTLALRGVPVPLEPRTVALDAQPLPRWPSTVVHAQLKRRLALGEADLVLEIELAQGESLAPSAPSQYRVLREGGLVAARAVAGTLDAARTSVALGVAGPGLLRVQALAYVCEASGTCTVRSHEWHVDIEVRERAPSHLVLAIATAE
ncbi:MAG: redoxin domain-containing protein [Planctomycetes bacterium]|nr:redoxin domain-containing protein [Planctomycetota bacterium]